MHVPNDVMPTAFQTERQVRTRSRFNQFCCALNFKRCASRAIAYASPFGYPTTLSITSGGEMKNPLDSLWGTVISGLVLTLILYNVIKFALQ
jgi:hypothetical protein